MRRIFVAEYCDPIHGWQLAELCKVPECVAMLCLAIYMDIFPHLHFELGLALC